MKGGLDCIMLVKTVDKYFPQQLLGAKKSEFGEWVTYSTEKERVKLLACCFRYLKIKDLYLHAAPPFQASSDQQSIMG